MKNGEKPIALEAYEKLALGYSAIAETKAENGYNAHPAIRSAMGDVRGLCVLDAGCGPGFLIRDLIDGGSSIVVGFDISPAMVRIAQHRAGSQAKTFVSDLAEPIPLNDACFDLVVSSLAIDYVRDWSVPLREFRRLLRSDGRLIFSVQHPMGSYDWYRPPSAFGVHYCEVEWNGFTADPVVVPDYYRSFEEIINPVIAADFKITGLHETRPIETLSEVDPKKYERGMNFPTFMVIEAVPQ